MATLVQSADIETLGIANNSVASPTSTNLSQHFVDSKFYLLVVIGEIVTEKHLKCAITDIEKGIRSWDTNLVDCDLDQELKLFVSRHSARFSSDVKGQRILHHKSNVLETVVLINPSDDAVSTEARLMISDSARHKLMVLSGQCYENTGELILQSGCFSFFNFIDIFTDQEIGELLTTIHPANKANLTLSCPEQGDWKNSNLDKHNLQDFINMKLNSALILPEMEGLSEFIEYLSESVEIPSPFDMLEPPTSGGFLKLSKPCCYIFPGGRGDSALFAVNGFNMLVNGGSGRKSCFWKLVRHLDRVDSILLTHVGDDNLPGINSMLQRKVAELEEELSQGSTANSDWAKNRISPDIGVVFVNLPESLGNPETNYRVRKNVEEAATIQQFLNKLNLKTESLQRPVGNTIEPIILFQKMGVGMLEMYVLNPSKNSKELQHFMKQWTGSEKDNVSFVLPNGKESEFPVSSLTSISSLIVWHPTNPSEKIVRVLFPGNATQHHILEGLEKLKHLEFLKQPVVTQNAMSAETTAPLKQAKMKHRTDSKESLKSTPKPSPSKSTRKPSKEEASEKEKADAESLQEKTQKKEKAPVRKEKSKAAEKEIKPKTEQAPATETPEKKRSEIKPKAMKEKIAKKEPKKSVEKKQEEKEVKKEATKKEEKSTAKKDSKKEEKVKKEEVKKDLKKDLRKESATERKEDKKEQKKEDSKKDVKRPSKDAKKIAPAFEAKRQTKPKPLIKVESSKTGSPSKLKDKPKTKVTQKEVKVAVAVAKAVNEAVAVLDVDVEKERSSMSSPEDLTKDFEELKAEELGEDGEAMQQTEQAVMIHCEEITQTKESPGAAESIDEGITTMEAEGDSGVTPDEPELKAKLGGGSEKFEDEGTGLEETSDTGDFLEKGETDAVHEPPTEKMETEKQSPLENNNELSRQREVTFEDAGVDNEAMKSHQQVQDVKETGTWEKCLLEPTSPKMSSPVSPAAFIHDEMIPVGFENDTVSDEENRDEAITSGHIQSTNEISSVPTPMDDVSTPKDETNIGKSSSLDLGKFPPSTHGDPKSDATEGRDYHPSASTISPPSSLEEDKVSKEFPFEEAEEGPASAKVPSEKVDHDSARLDSASSTSPLVRSPSVEHKVNMDSLLRFAAPIELGTTLAGSPRGTTQTSISPDEKTLEGTTSPQSSGHTPYYQSPVEEKARILPSTSEDTNQGPIIVEVTSDREDSSKSVSPEPKEVERDASSPVEKMASPQPSPPPLEPEFAAMKFDAENRENGHVITPPAPLLKRESDTNITFKEDSKMSISEGTTSDKSGTPIEEAVAEDTFSHFASASTASLATCSFLEPTTDSPSLHAEVGSPHSTEVDDSLSVSVVQTPTTFHETEGSPSKEDSPRPMSISPDISPKAKMRTQAQDTKSPEQSTMSIEFGQESPDHSLALDFSKQSPEHPSLAGSLRATENGPTEVDYSPTDGTDPRPSEHDGCIVDTPLLFSDIDAAQATSASPSDASQSTPSVTTPSVTTPCQMTEMAPRQADKSPLIPKAVPLAPSPLSTDSSPVIGGQPDKEDSPTCLSEEGLSNKSDTEQTNEPHSFPNIMSPSASFSLSEHDGCIVEPPLLFSDIDAAQATSVSPSDASQSTPSVTTPSATTPCQMTEMMAPRTILQADKSPLTPKAVPLAPSPLSTDSSPVTGGQPGKEDSPTCLSEEGLSNKSDTQQTNEPHSFPNIMSPSASFSLSKTEELSPRETNPFKCDMSPQSKSPVSPKVPFPSSLPLASNYQRAGGSQDPESSKKSSSPKSKTDVDLCLVTSCEYRHPKTELSPSFINPNPLEYFMNEEMALEEEILLTKSGGPPPPPGGKLPAKQCDETPPTSISESAPSQTDSDVPPGTEECPSITADANIDSEDDSETLPTDRTLTYRQADPPPTAARDAAPSSPRPDVCMPDPEALKAKEDQDAAEKSKKKKLTKKSSSPARKGGLSKVKEAKTASPKKTAGEGKDVKNATNTSASRTAKSTTSGAGNVKTSGGVPVPNCPPMYMDLVYIPNHCSAKNVDAEFFKRVRSSYYVVSGNDQAAQEPNKAVLDALLEGKAQWGSDMQVTLIPTHDSDVMREWYQETHDKQQELNIMVLASSSTVVMQDESFPACKIEL